MISTGEPRKARGDVFTVWTSPSRHATRAFLSFSVAVAVFAGSVWRCAADTLATFASVLARSLARVAATRLCCCVVVPIPKALCICETSALDSWYQI